MKKNPRLTIVAALTVAATLIGVFPAAGKEAAETMTAEQKAAYQNHLIEMLAAADRYTEPYRPQFHFTPIFDWMNDPNGLVYDQGEYHLFFQHNPLGRRWGNMSWGHAVSTDLVHWKQISMALWPDEIGTIFSGSAVVDHHDTSGFFGGKSGLVAIFTHHNMDTDLEQQSIAYSSDQGRTWTKYDGNPVIPNVGDRNFRDPKVFWHKATGRWIMIVAGGKVRFYSSPNLREWTLESMNEDIRTECPDFFELPVDGNQANTRWVLSKAGRGYIIGRFDGRVFTPESEPMRVVVSPEPYASQTYSDTPDGRRIVLDWMRPRGDDRRPATVWTSSMSLPQVIELKSSPGGLHIVRNPVEELKNLRGKSWTWKDRKVSSSENLLEQIRGRTLEIVAEFKLGTAKEFGFKVLKGDQQQTVVGYRASDSRLFVDRTHSGDGRLERDDRVVEAELPAADGKIKLHIFVDWSKLDVFAGDGGKVFASTIYPKPESDRLELYTAGGDVRLISLEVYKLKSAWRE